MLLSSCKELKITNSLLTKVIVTALHENGKYLHHNTFIPLTISTR